DCCPRAQRRSVGRAPACRASGASGRGSRFHPGAARHAHHHAPSRAGAGGSSMKNHVSLTVNGRHVEVEIEPRLNLADFLREHLNLTAPHLGCEHGVCGACTVLADGKPIRACIALAVSMEGAEIRTLEGLQGDPLMETLKDAFHEKHGLQCGFCT